MTSPRIALCVGHSRYISGRRDGGARSVGGVAEWPWNVHLASLISGHLRRYRIPHIVISEYPGIGYTTAVRALATRLRDESVTGAVELHFNSAGPTARGHEWIHWHSSLQGRRMATCLDREMRMQLPPDLIPARGLKPRIRPRTATERANNRGWQFTAWTHCPAVIAEPFFGSNPDDWKLANDHKPKIALAIANGIDAWIG